MNWFWVVGQRGGPGAHPISGRPPCFELRIEITQLEIGPKPDCVFVGLLF